ncbi:sugar kinase [Aurantiacibacter aquimixticola]|uniref:Sugar kinase n=1 Tax=Aurantiacibacter aquimixticola TaxID=1958945 RepID=A0A419RW51_9SPHN|nr:sugar kinase [Aurantiacibacter aquimixticola]RJY10009.1 sugar kinase [Aurantiacibacter aquimixticola]
MTSFIFGEAMLEYHSHGSSGLRYGGDTLNTAIHMARAGHDVAYVTALGTDPISDALVAAWAAEGIDTRFVLRHPTRSPGIYAIHLDENGERSFLYWRDRSAAREMFALPGMADAVAAAREAEMLYFSLISLAVVDEAGRDALVGLARDVKAAGKTVAYDSNYRPLLWPDPAAAQAASRAATQAATLGLPTNVDEQQIYGDARSEEQIAANWQGEGCSLVVVKAGETGCLIAEAGSEPMRQAAKQIAVVDTSGAGDAFNAGFLSAYLDGRDIADCAEAGQAQSREVLQHHGAVPPRG